MAGGRPTKLTAQVQESILVAIRGGNYLETAAAFAGIDADTLRRWVKRGARESKGRYREFYGSLKKALADGEAVHVARIGAASGEHWQASAWMLERKHPEKWGRKDKVQVTLTDGPAAQALVEILRRYIAAEKWDEFCDELESGDGLAGVREAV